MRRARGPSRRRVTGCGARRGPGRRAALGGRRLTLRLGGAGGAGLPARSARYARSRARPFRASGVRARLGLEATAAASPGGRASASCRDGAARGARLAKRPAPARGALERVQASDRARRASRHRAGSRAGRCRLPRTAPHKVGEARLRRAHGGGCRAQSEARRGLLRLSASASAVERGDRRASARQLRLEPVELEQRATPRVQWATRPRAAGRTRQAASRSVPHTGRGAAHRASRSRSARGRETVAEHQFVRPATEAEIPAFRSVHPLRAS